MKKPTYQEIQQAQDILKSAGYIDVFWTIEDIIGMGSELLKPRKITVKQARKIAELIARRHDSCIGLNLVIIDIFINEYFVN